MRVISRVFSAVHFKDIRCTSSLSPGCRSYHSSTTSICPEPTTGETIFNWKKYRVQRFYCQSPNSDRCWNCKAVSSKDSPFICSECGKLQDVAKEYDYFKLLSLPQEFDVPSTKLTKMFRQLQTMVHPDKYSNKSQREKENSAEWSALINKAYKTLSQPIVRGQYLLKLRGEEMPSENTALDKQFLLEMMERNEDVDNAKSKEDLSKMCDEVQKEINSELSDLKGLFETNDLTGVKGKLVKTKYLLSIQNSIKMKLDKLAY